MFYKDGFSNLNIQDAILAPDTEYTFNCGTDRIQEARTTQLDLQWFWNGTQVTGTAVKKVSTDDAGIFLLETSYTFTTSALYNDTTLQCFLMASSGNEGIVADPVDSVRILLGCTDSEMCPDMTGCYQRCDGVSDCDDLSDETGCPVYGLNTTVEHQWYGGFVGKIDLDIVSPTTAWMLTLEFRRKIYKLDVGDAIILDKHDYGFVYHLGNTPCNGKLAPGDNLEIMFLADIFYKFKGIKADVTFQYEGPGTPPLNMTMIE